MASSSDTTKIIDALVAIISLARPLSRIIVFSLALGILALIPPEQLRIPIPSLYETVLGITPYSSGMTRAVSQLLHGHFAAAWMFNPLAYVLVSVALVMLGKDLYSIVQSKDYSI
jgi:hypothetical protein